MNFEERGRNMPGHIYKTVEITGTSSNSIEDAVRNAVSRTSHSLKNLRWFKLDEIRGKLDQNHVTEWQATVKISFTVEE